MRHYEREKGTYAWPFCFLSPPSSKCLQRLRAICILYLQTVHSSRRTTFLVVLAFLWKTGLV